MRSEDHEAQATAHQLVHCVLEADSVGLTETLETVAAQPSDDLRPYVREVVAELINVATTAVRDCAGPLRDRAAFAIDLRDDDNDQVGIDDLEPPVRATIRAMLAELNNSPDDASFQLDLAVRGVDHRTGLDTVRRALTMTVGLLNWTEQPDPLDGAMDIEPTADDFEREFGAFDEATGSPDVQQQRRAPEDDER
jgi:hypothetical protein